MGCQSGLEAQGSARRETRGPRRARAQKQKKPRTQAPAPGIKKTRDERRKTRRSPFVFVSLCSLMSSELTESHLCSICCALLSTPTSPSFSRVSSPPPPSPLTPSLLRTRSHSALPSVPLTGHSMWPRTLAPASRGGAKPVVGRCWSRSRSRIVQTSGKFAVVKIVKVESSARGKVP